MLMTTLTLNLAVSPLSLAAMNPIVINLMVGGFLLVSIVMILIVLIQRPQGGGLGGAFGAGGGGGGGGAGQTAFGTKTGDVLTGGTIAIFVLFLLFAIVLNFATRPSEAEPAQPTIAAPATTEPIPVEEDASDDAATDGDALDSMIEQAEEVADDLQDAAQDTADDAAGEVPDPSVDDEN